MRQVDATVGLVCRGTLVESVAIVGEVHGVRHRRVAKLAGDLILYLAIDVEGAAWGLFTSHAGGDGRCHVGDVAVILQPGTLAFEVNANTCISRARTAVKSVALALCLGLTGSSLSRSMLASNLLSVGTLLSLASSASFCVLQVKVLNPAAADAIQPAVDAGFKTLT